MKQKPIELMHYSCCARMVPREAAQSEKKRKKSQMVFPKTKRNQMVFPKTIWGVIQILLLIL